MKVLPFAERGLVHKVEGSFFCLFFHESSKEWKAFEGDIHEIENIKTHLNFIENNKIKVKLIGRKKAEEIFTNIMGKTQWKDFTFVPRNHSFDIVFDNIDKTLRVSKEIIHEAKVATKVNDKKIKLLLVDDSKTILTLLTTIFKTDPWIEIVAAITNPLDVESCIEKYKPDVITLDIHMPQMTGVDVLKKIKNKYKIPAIMITSLSLNEGSLVLEALENGAFDYVQKPKMEEIKALTSILIEKVKAAARVDMGNLTNAKSTGIISINRPIFKGELDKKLILMGSSTGGTNALSEILPQFPKEIPPIVIVQHIPPVFSAAFAKRLNELCSFEVKESEDGDEIIPGRVIIARGGVQIGIKKIGDSLKIVHTDDPPVNRFKPSVDYLFNSAAKCLCRKTAAVILTGMGDDGARGMLNLKNLGVETIAQDEKSSVVYGMPKEAFDLGGVKYVESLKNIGNRLAQALNQPSETLPLNKVK